MTFERENKKKRPFPTWLSLTLWCIFAAVIIAIVTDPTGMWDDLHDGVQTPDTRSTYH